MIYLLRKINMSEIILTEDDLNLADEMNQLYSSKNGVNLTDNQVEFLRLLGIKNRSPAATKKLKMLIKLYRQEKRFLAAKAKAQGMIKREKDARRKQEQRLFYVIGEGVSKAIKSDIERKKEDKLFTGLRRSLFIACAVGVIQKKDWMVIQKAFLSNIKITNNWVNYIQSSPSLDKTLAKALMLFFADNLIRLGSPLTEMQLNEMVDSLNELAISETL